MRSGRFVDRLLDLLLPPVCPGCGTEGDPICAACLPAFEVRLGEPPGAAIGSSVDLPAPLLQLEWCAAYEGVVRAALHALKYAGETRLAAPIGEAMARRWAVAGAGGDVLVPVPVHGTRRRERGYDQAELLARVAAEHLGLPAVAALERARPTRPQFDLDRRDRAANVADAFRTVDPPLVAGRWVVLVDDVVTTGATLSACARALLDAGAVAVSALTAARER
ncbi:MAG: amidophosphoribosyltransferase [Chloroflexota bacterium]|nr:MAG: amidophosphoribosyltransferase [Chloroflexota bacterium]